MSNVPRPANYNRVIPYLILTDDNGFLKYAETVLGCSIAETHYQENGTLVHGATNLMPISNQP